jgi:hypothetical protein
MNINETIPMMPSAEIAPGLELIPHEDNQVEAQKFTLLQNQELVGVIKLVLQKEKTARLVSAADNSHLPHSVPSYLNMPLGKLGATGCVLPYQTKTPRLKPL